VAIERWIVLKQKASAIGRPLTCPQCTFRFAWRHYRRSGQACPRCKVLLGTPFYYRLTLLFAGYVVMGWTMYAGCETYGFGWVFMGLPISFVLAILTQGGILRTFPPKLYPYAEGRTWLKLA
jgi:hypothetical protein